jgi:hypothetical protein
MNGYKKLSACSGSDPGKLCPSEPLNPTVAVSYKLNAEEGTDTLLPERVAIPLTSSVAPSTERDKVPPMKPIARADVPSGPSAPILACKDQPPNTVTSSVRVRVAEIKELPLSWKLTSVRVPLLVSKPGTVARKNQNRFMHCS